METFKNLFADNTPTISAVYVSIPLQDAVYTPIPLQDAVDETPTVTQNPSNNIHELLRQRENNTLTVTGPCGHWKITKNTLSRYDVLDNLLMESCFAVPHDDAISYITQGHIFRISLVDNKLKFEIDPSNTIRLSYDQDKWS